MTGLAILIVGLEAGPGFAEAVPDRKVFFGELHIHSSWSIDAYVFGTRKLGPADAVRYARGEAVTHPGGFEVKLAEPLDFTTVMDHSEYTGAFPMADDPESPLRKNSPLVADLLRFGAWANGMDLYKLLSVSLVKGMPIETLQGPEVAGYAWKELGRIADESYEPGKFTTFPGWEWTSTPDYKNLHRIVFFKDPSQVSASEFSSLDSTSPADLWKWMDAQRAQGHDVVAITHNGNLSDGVLYPRERAWGGGSIDEAYAETRMRNEPVTEISQVKGQSETTPRLSPEDEFADFNVFVWLLLGAKGTPTDYGSYIRLALRDGIAMQGARGFNPYRFGFVAGSDSHSAASAYRQDDYFGEHGLFDATPKDRMSPVKHLGMDNRQVDPAGLTGVWAEENTRDALWAAIHRKETYATSGLRMKVRFFGGWDYPATATDAKDWARTGYAKGVPMGGTLPAPSAESPTFIVWAERDPSGPNLDRVQIVKGWAKNGQSFEKIYDVAWAGARKPDPATGKLPPIGSSVDLAKGTYRNTIGTDELKTVWSDPDFDPALDAFYYVRALAIPAPRWTTIEAAKLGVTPPTGFALTVQDRAWSSPIWYTPTDEARKRAAPGLTVAEITRQGGRALDEAELEALVVGKTFDVHNTVTGREVTIIYGVNGRRLVTAVDGKNPDPNVMGGLMFDSEAPYEIRDGRLVTTIGGTPFDVTVYRLGDRYLAARADELGYANYQVEVSQ